MVHPVFVLVESLMLRSRPNRDYVDTAAIVQNRRRISMLLQRQEPIEDAFAGMSFNGSAGKSGEQGAVHTS